LCGENMVKKWKLFVTKRIFFVFRGGFFGPRFFFWGGGGVGST